MGVSIEQIELNEEEMNIALEALDSYEEHVLPVAMPRRSVYELQRKLKNLAISGEESIEVSLSIDELDFLYRAVSDNETLLCSMALDPEGGLSPASMADYRQYWKSAKALRVRLDDALDGSDIPSISPENWQVYLEIFPEAANN